MTTFERIRKLAKQNGINLKDLATTLGFSQNLFYRWKTTNPKASDLEKVADYFNVSVDYLLGRENKYKTDIVEIDLQNISEDTMSFGNQKLTDKDKEFITNFLQAYFKAKDED